MSGNIGEAFQGLEIGRIEEIIIQKLNQGEDPFVLIKECQDEMVKVGKKFESGDYYLSELILSSKLFERAAKILSPKLKEKNSSPQKGLPLAGKIVLGTPKGDIHDLGKNIFKLLAEVSGFEVIDLGVDVPSQIFLETVRKEQPQIVGMSGLITTVYPSMIEVVDLLNQNGIRNKVKVIIGGGATGEEAKRLVGADAQTLDAAVGVRICRELITDLEKKEGNYDRD